MTARIPIHFLDVGRRKVPTLDVTITMRRGRGALTESALIDTGSHVTIFSKDLLRLNGFPVDQAHEDKTGVHGLGGAERLFYIGPAVAAFEDITGDVHYLRVPRLHFTKVRMPPIFGTDDLRSLQARLFVDFTDETGHLELE